MELYRRKTLPWRVVDKEALVVNPRDSLVYPFNAVSARIWQLLDGSRGLEEIIGIIHNEFEADKEVIARDAAGFIRQLKEAGLIEKV